MAIVTKTLRDSSGATFKMRFWDDGAGNLSPLHALTADAGEALPVQVSGRSAVVIGGSTFYTDGSVIYGLVAARPDAADAHAVIPYGFYLAVDSGVLSRNTGTAWAS